MKRVLVLAAVFTVLLGAPGVVAADDGDGEASSDTCATDLANCYVMAAKVDSFWYRWAAGLDCELQFANCTRIMIIGR